MQLIVSEDAKVLTPNPAHKNFTETPEIIKAGTIVTGEIKKVQGLRKGEPFVYRIFKTADNKIIYLNKTKPMEKTEVTLGADAAQTPTVVKLPSTSDFGWKPVVGTLVGLFVSHRIVKKKNLTAHKKWITYIAGAGLGFGAGYLWQTHGSIKVKTSK